MVEAAGVEPVPGIENMRVADFKKGEKGKKGQNGKSTVQTLYKKERSSIAICAFTDARHRRWTLGHNIRGRALQDECDAILYAPKCH